MSEIIEATVVPVDTKQLEMDIASDQTKASALAAKAATRQAALDKLGLTADEVAALFG